MNKKKRRRSAKYTERKSRTQKPFGPKQHFHSKPTLQPHPYSVHELQKSGVVQANEKGFGFFIPDDGTDDAFLPPSEMQHVMDGDQIVAMVRSDPRKPGKFVARFSTMVRPSRKTILGIIAREQQGWVLKPDDPRIVKKILILPSKDTKVAPGLKAVLEITKIGALEIEGIITRILGAPNDPALDMESVIYKYEWPIRFPMSVEASLDRIPSDPSAEDFKDREDLRNLPILTIDGADAKDFDDALSLEKDTLGRDVLGVHIADVSHYVQPGSSLDVEAQNRATSLYLPDRVLPMLPHHLSDGLCSLKEGVPRLTLSVFMTFDHNADLVSTRFCKSVIRSRRRGIYEEIQACLEGTAEPSIAQKYAALKEMIVQMMQLSRKLRNVREKQGALDFNFPELRVKLDSQGHVEGVYRKPRLETHRLVEDFMIKANEVVAGYLDQKKMPTIYRIHEAPSPNDLEDLISFLKAFSVPFKNLDFTQANGLQSLLNKVKGTSLEKNISQLVLRSLKLAVYSTRNAGHFALALKSYCHFTSPIRRYPDLMAHRALKHVLEGVVPRSEQPLPKIATDSSRQERTAEKAERESQQILQIRFSEKLLGQRLQASISHLTAFGMYAELEPYGIEGFIPLENLKDDHYRYEPTLFCITGRHGNRFRLGDKIRVQPISTDIPKRRLILGMAP